jgi:hypothetical protein
LGVKSLSKQVRNAQSTEVHHSRRETGRGKRGTRREGKMKRRESIHMRAYGMG